LKLSKLASLVLLSPTMTKIDKISVSLTREQHDKIKAAV
jgi:hypothetical protein